jgi:hypothetical protein
MTEKKEDRAKIDAIKAKYRKEAVAGRSGP